jgi:hypothetical protein
MHLLSHASRDSVSSLQPAVTANTSNSRPLIVHLGTVPAAAPQPTGQLLGLDAYLHERTNGMIGSLSRSSAVSPRPAATVRRMY